MASQLHPFVPPAWAIPESFLEPLPQWVVPLARKQTPIERWSLPEMPEDVRVQIKRDDTTGDVLLCGNKVRKLEFLLADAIAKGCDACVTVGGSQSNHARATVAAARRLGLSPHLVLRDDAINHSEPQSGNLFLDCALGAEVTLFPKPGFQSTVRVQERCDQLRTAGRRPYGIPSGGSCPLGCWGYMTCFEEIRSQAADIEKHTIVAAVGSGATALGLALGNGLWAKGGAAPQWNVVGYTVCDSPDYFHESFDTTLQQLVAPQANLQSRRLIDLRDAAGEGYGKATQVELQFLSHVARETGILLDPSYTNKAAMGMVRDAQQGLFAGRTVTFVHTGGGPGAFAYQSQVTNAIAS